MAAADTDHELEEQLLEAGNKLADPPSSAEELLPLLDQVEKCLSRVEQSPAQSMQDALAPSLNALISDRLLRHSDADVKVAVATCISEITRISAPEAPYDDDQMKEVFQLIVSSFKDLFDMSSRSYTKRTVILETVSKVRSCVVMLDLECDALILEMFQHFLKEIREHHPKNVFSSMETIMTLVLEESEDISPSLLAPILDSVKKVNEEVLPIARKLGECVLKSCATKLKPYLVQAVNTLGISLDDYSDVLASICHDASGSLEQNDENESGSLEEPLEESAPVAREDAKDAASPQQENPVGDRSPKSVMSNGIAQAAEDEAFVDSKSLEKQENSDYAVQSKGINLLGGIEEPNNLDTDKVDNSEQKLGQATNRRRRKLSSSTKLAEPSGNEGPNGLGTEKVDSSEQKLDKPSNRRGGKLSSSTKSAEPSEGSYPANVKEDEKMLDSSHRKEVPSHVDDSVEAAGLSENDKEIDAKISSLKASNGESDVVASPSLSGSLHGENRSKKLGRPKKKDISAKEVAAKDLPRKAHEVTSDSEAKPKRSGKKALGHSSNVKKYAVVDSVKKGNGTASDPDAKKHSAKKAEDSSKGGGGSSSRLSEDKKRHGHGKANSETAVAKSSVKDQDKEMESSLKSAMKSIKDEESEVSPKTSLKRKRTPRKESVSGTKKYGENLVGSRVKVWWPEDEMFYEGVVDSFDSTKKTHMVNYDDGDVEILHLKNEKWEVITADANSDGEGEGDRTTADVSAYMHPKKKGKTSAGESKKKRKRDAASISGGDTSSKSKGKSMKSSHKSNDDSIADLKSKASKIISKSEDEVIKKTKNHTPKSGGGKSTDAVQKMTSKSKDIEKDDDDVSTPKLSGKSKQETQKTGKSKQETSKTAASKTKSTKSGVKSNGTKVKFNLLKTKDSDSDNSENSVEEVEEEVEDMKRKISSSSSKAGGSEGKSAKKRARN